MKKVLLLAILLPLLSLGVFAQNSHMTFQGIPIDGSAEEFSHKLVNKGFNLVKTTEKYSYFSGTFANEECGLGINITPVSKNVWRVLIVLPSKSSWFTLKSQYKNFKISYTQKYGSPTSYEFFLDPYYEGDGYEMSALHLKKCVYMSLFSVDNGKILLSMSDDHLTIIYEDAINSEKSENEKNNIRYKDI